MNITLVQDIAILLLAAGIAGIICKKIGLSVIVGYLLAGVVIGPYTPIKMITSQERIEELSQVGLVFVMFAIGLHLSITKLAKMGVATMIATALGAIFMFQFTLLLGYAMEWEYKISLYVAAMLMVSSSAVIAKVMEELHLTHNKTAQMSLAMTIQEDIVAVTMLTILATIGGNAALSADKMEAQNQTAPTALVSEAAPAGTGSSQVFVAPDQSAPDTTTPTTDTVGETSKDVPAGAESARPHAEEEEEKGGIGTVFANITSYVVLILGLCLLIVPKLLKRLDMSGDPEIRTIVVAGLLLFLAVCAAQAGFSTALGAFLFGAIIAEVPQRDVLEKSFDSVRSIFSSIFFVSIGMMINPSLLLDQWLLILILVGFALFVRPFACGLALIIVGVHPKEARRGGLLLTPLGEFTFIIAQAGIAAAVLEDYFYPVAVALSIFTVLATPIINRFADPILALADKLEPKWISRATLAYHEWLKQLQNRPSKKIGWKLIRPRLFQIFVEMLLVSGILIFSGQILAAIEKRVLPTAGEPNSGWFSWLDSSLLETIYWSAIGFLVLVPLFALWRNVSATAMILAEQIESHLLPRKLVAHSVKAAAAIGIGFWLYPLLPTAATTFTLWGWVAILGATAIIIAVFSHRLIYWHSSWRATVQEVLTTQNSPTEAKAEARANIDQGLEDWDIHLQECEIPDNTAHSGQTLHELAIPSRFGSSVVEIERNGHSILTPGPNTRLYPGDKLLLLGKTDEIAAAREFLESKDNTRPSQEIFSRAVLETCVVEKSPHSGKSFAELQITQNTGVRVVGIQRGDKQIINPTGKEVLVEGDGLLLVGTIEQTRKFASWLAGPKPTVA
ncbi:MAG: cation:proton antiporter [Puniceicoccales bacterium]|jgi:CPA2 family monovalent cation:H+ antiporter-2|nr:cation:proton antiporter [Puniceicoccales bacterium]